MRMIFDGCSSFEHSVRNLEKTLRITGSRGEIKQGDPILLLQIFNVLTVNWTKFWKKLDSKPLLWDGV